MGLVGNYRDRLSVILFANVEETAMQGETNVFLEVFSFIRLTDKEWSVVKVASTKSPSSLIYIKNNKGPWTDPGE